jgi:hypothetical protein
MRIQVIVGYVEATEALNDAKGANGGEWKTLGMYDIGGSRCGSDAGFLSPFDWKTTNSLLSQLLY